MENVWRCLCSMKKHKAVLSWKVSLQVLGVFPLCSILYSLLYGRDRLLLIIKVSWFNDVFPFPAFLSVSVGVMLIPVAQDLASLITPSYQVFFHYFNFKNNFSLPSLLQILPFFCCEGHFKGLCRSYATLFSNFLSNRSHF